MARRFARTPEDFVCAACGGAVSGDGYTNHCPSCLWSRHVDVNPGDRAASCGGMMKPVAVEFRADGGFVLSHLCVACGHRRRNRGAAADDGGAVIALAAAAASEALSAGVLPGADPGSGGGAHSVRSQVRDRGRGSGAPRRPGRRR